MPGVDPDLELLDRWCAGDKAGGSALFKRYFDDVYRFFEHKVSSDVDDLVQETFLACVRRRDQFRRQSSFRTFVFAVARFELYAYWRRRAHRGQALDFSEISVADLVTTPASRMAREQDRDRMLHALRSLPLEQQLLLELHYWEQLDGERLAEVFDIAPATVRTRLFRARAALRERIEQMGSAPAGLLAGGAGFDEWVQSMRADRDASGPDDAAPAPKASPPATPEDS
jgi:RNA polymerase sigma factor (sigma-70 family)